VRPLIRIAFILSVTSLLIVGCSNTKPYKAELPHNLRVNTKVEKVKASLDIYGIDKQCKSSYQGTIALNKKTLNIGIPAAKSSYLSIGFAGSSFLRSSSSYTSQGTLLQPRKGYRYMIDATYLDGIYNVAFYEIKKSSGKRRELELRGISSCNK